MTRVGSQRHSKKKEEEEEIRKIKKKIIKMPMFPDIQLFSPYEMFI